MQYEYDEKAAAKKLADNVESINALRETLWLAGVRGYPAKVTLRKRKTLKHNNKP